MESGDENVIQMKTACEKYGLDIKRLRGLCFRDGLSDPIGDPYRDLVVDDWRLQRLAQKQ